MNAPIAQPEARPRAILSREVDVDTPCRCVSESHSIEFRSFALPSPHDVLITPERSKKTFRLRRDRRLERFTEGLRDGSLAVPVLDQEPVVWPENLFELAVERRLADRWRAYHVRPRTEKVVARYLRSRNIAYFLPQIERRKRYQRRLVRSHLVLFPGYAFALLDEQNLERGFESKEIIRSLSIDNQQQLDSELRDIHRLIQSGQPLTREERLQPGNLARIISGPLAGLCGRVVKNKRAQKFVLQVQFLQRGVSVEIDSTMLEAL
jgi:transcription antitermination factor NusG